MTTETKQKRPLHPLVPLGIGVGYGLMVGFMGGAWIMKDIPTTDTKFVQPGYVAPRDISIDSTDLNNDSCLETIVNIGEKSYLLKYVDNKPTLAEYVIKPTEIIEVR